MNTIDTMAPGSSDIAWHGALSRRIRYEEKGQEKQASRALDRLFPMVRSVSREGADPTKITGTHLFQSTPRPMSAKWSGSSRLQTYIDRYMQHARDAAVPQGLRGMGLGRKLYGREIREAYERWLKGEGPRYFMSDRYGNTSDDAVALWESLSRRGYPVQARSQLPAYIGSNKMKFGIDLDDMRKFYKSSSVFTDLARASLVKAANRESDELLRDAGIGGLAYGGAAASTWGLGNLADKLFKDRADFHKEYLNQLETPEQIDAGMIRRINHVENIDPGNEELIEEIYNDGVIRRYIVDGLRAKANKKVERLLRMADKGKYVGGLGKYLVIPSAIAGSVSPLISAAQQNVGDVIAKNRSKKIPASVLASLAAGGLLAGGLAAGGISHMRKRRKRKEEEDQDQG